jgi:hypothetical protein
MKSLVFVSVVIILLAGLFVHPTAAPRAPAKSAPERAEWRDAQTKHWRGIILRKD